jgi:hypothetical protein
MARLKLSKHKREVLKDLAGFCEKNKFFLVGGSNMSLRFNHRDSEDLDWFTLRNFDTRALMTLLREADLEPKLISESSNSLHITVRGVRLSFLRFDYKADVERGTSGAPFASLKTLAAMKILAIANRGTRKDFYDVHVLMKNGWPLKKQIEAARDMIPKLSVDQITRSLKHFAEADKDHGHYKYVYTWPTVKKDISAAMAKYAEGR